jgi:hypothetical protein
MKKIIFALLFAVPFFGIAQDVDFDKKTDEVIVDGSKVFKIERSGCGFGSVDCHYDIFDLEGNKLFKVNYRDFNSPVEVSKANPEGTVKYFEFVFFSSKQKAETDFTSIKEIHLAKFIVKNKLVKDGKINQPAVDEFVFSAGTPFADRVKY